MKKLALSLTIGLIYLATFSSAHAQLIFYDFSQVGGTTNLSPTSTDTLVSGSTFVPATTAAQNADMGLGFATTTVSLFTSETLGLADGLANNIENANDNGQFFEFTATADSGATLDLSSLSFDIGRVANGALDFAIRSSVDGFTDDLLFANDAIAVQTQAALPSLTSTQTLDLDTATASVDPTDFDDLTSITFRIILDDRNSNSGSSSGTFIDNLTLAGTASVAVPEPSSLVVLGLGFAGLLARRRR